MSIPTEGEIQNLLRGFSHRINQKKYSAKAIYECIQRYSGRTMAYKEALKELRTFIDEAPELKGEIHSIRTRTKDVYSLIDKLRRKCLDSDRPRNIQADDLFDPKEGVTDLGGIRILHLYKDQWMPIHDFLNDQNKIPGFTLIEKTVYIRKGEDGSRYEDQFGSNNIKEHPHRYTSLHYIFRWKSASHSDLYIECQVRTLFEEAWGEIDHHKRYPFGASELVSTQLRILDKATDIADDIALGLQHLDRLPLFVSWEEELRYERSAKRVLVLSRKLQWLANHISEFMDQLTESEAEYIYFVPEMREDHSEAVTNWRFIKNKLQARSLQSRVQLKWVRTDLNLPILSDLLLLVDTIDFRIRKERSLGVIGAPFGVKPLPNERLDMLVFSEEEVSRLNKFFGNLEEKATTNI